MGQEQGLRYPRLEVDAEQNLNDLVRDIKRDEGEGVLIPFVHSNDYDLKIFNLDQSVFEIEYNDGTIVRRESWEEFCSELVAGLSFLRPGQSASVRVVLLREVVQEEYSGPVDEHIKTSDN